MVSYFDKIKNNKKITLIFDIEIVKLKKKFHVSTRNQKSNQKLKALNLQYQIGVFISIFQWQFFLQIEKSNKSIICKITNKTKGWWTSKLRIYCLDFIPSSLFYIRQEIFQVGQVSTDSIFRKSKRVKLILLMDWQWIILKETEKQNYPNRIVFEVNEDKILTQL